MNLIGGLHQELDRARELLKWYEELPAGVFGATVIKNTIKQAEESMQLGDTVGMVTAYEMLKKLE